MKNLLYVVLGTNPESFLRSGNCSLHMVSMRYPSSAPGGVERTNCFLMVARCLNAIVPRTPIPLNVAYLERRGLQFTRGPGVVSM